MTFAQKEFHEANTDIAKQAGVGEATIYNYFENKEDLLIKIPVERTREAGDLLAEHLEGIKGSINRIRKIVWFFFHYWETHPNFSTIIQLMWRVNKKYFHLDPHDLRHKLVGYILRTIEEGQKEGFIDQSINVRLCRNIMLDIMEGTPTRWLLRRSDWSLTDNAAEVADIIIKALHAPVPHEGVLQFNIQEVNVLYGGKIRKGGQKG